MSATPHLHYSHSLPGQICEALKRCKSLKNGHFSFDFGRKAVLFFVLFACFGIILWLFRDQQAQDYFRPFRSDLAILVSLLRFIPVINAIGMFFVHLDHVSYPITPNMKIYTMKEVISKNLVTLVTKWSLANPLPQFKPQLLAFATWGI